MERSKARGRPLQDNSKEVDEEPGRRIKMVQKHKAYQLKARNYDIFDEDADSIDISEIIHGLIPSKISIEALNAYNQSNKRLTFRNYQTEDDSNQITIGPTIKIPIIQQIAKYQNTSQIAYQQNEKNFEASQKLKLQEKIEQPPIKFEVAMQKKQLFQDENIKRQQQAFPEQNDTQYQIRRLSRKSIKIMKADFALLRPEIPKESLKSMSEKYGISQNQFLKMHNDWKKDKNLTQYSKESIMTRNQKNQSNMKEQNEIMKSIRQIIQRNPHYNIQEVRRQLKKRHPSNFFYLRSVLRMISSAGYKRKDMYPLLINSSQQVVRERNAYIQSFRKHENIKGSRFFYLGECFLHKSLTNGLYWALDKQKAPVYSSSFVAEGFMIIAFLTPGGNLLWEARMGNYELLDYVKLITKMIKKHCKMPHDVLIVNETTQRNMQEVNEIASKFGCSTLMLPLHSANLSPFHFFFQQLKEKMKQCFEGEGQKVLDKLEDVIKQMNQFHFIEKSKKQMSIISQ